MIESSESFWDASPDEMKRGYVFEEEQQAYCCLVCGKHFEKGIIYEHDGVFYEAERYARIHLELEHTSMLDCLLDLDKKWTGLTELQRKVIHLFSTGMGDNEIAREMGGSSSTIRNHRFTLREKAKQAKVFLAIMELMEANAKNQSKFIPIHRTATMLDERYAITEEENEEILNMYFKEGLDGPLSEFPKKEKRKIALMRQLIRDFEPNRFYAEREVNDILERRFPDFVTLRRYLIDYGFLDRKPDGSSYWVKR